MTEHLRSLRVQYLANHALEMLDLCPCPSNQRRMANIFTLADLEDTFDSPNASVAMVKLAAVLVKHVKQIDSLKMHTIGAGRAMDDEERGERGAEPTC